MKLFIAAALVAAAVLLAGCTAPTSTPAPATPPPTRATSTPTPAPATSTPAAAGDPQKGKTLFETGATPSCKGCHSTGADKLVGPGLKGIGAKESTEHLREALLEPNKHVEEGYPAIMPAYTSLSESQIQDLIAYLKTL